MTEKIARFLAEHSPDTPCLVVDLDVIAEAYEALCWYLPLARIYYAVKANPAADIIATLERKGANFDVASRGEIELCSANGVPPERLSFGNTIKKEKDIAFAYNAGVRLFAFDSANEFDKLARAAPGARVFCRILVPCDGAEWPLSRKFGCAPEMAIELLRKARDAGLDAYGVSFHVGSQQTDLGQWDGAVGTAARMFSALAEADINLRMVNIGGGFPAHYRG
jgi:ornithine decarboxylase